jgi:hypothetical protein
MQNSSAEVKANRREFFRTAARYVSLAGLAGGVASLVALRRVDTSGAGCAKNRFCGDCARLSFCQLPPAPAARLALRLSES